MKKTDLTKLALLGIGAALTLGGCQKQTTTHTNNKVSAAEQLSPEAQSFYNQLSPEKKQKFLQLDEQHQRAAIRMPTDSCSGPQGCGQTAPNDAVDWQYGLQMKGK